MELKYFIVENARFHLFKRIISLGIFYFTCVKQTGLVTNNWLTTCLFLLFSVEYEQGNSVCVWLCLCGAYAGPVENAYWNLRGIQYDREVLLIQPLHEALSVQRWKEHSAALTSQHSTLCCFYLKLPDSFNDRFASKAIFVNISASSKLKMEVVLCFLFSFFVSTFAVDTQLFETTDQSSSIFAGSRDDNTTLNCSAFIEETFPTVDGGDTVAKTVGLSVIISLVSSFTIGGNLMVFVSVMIFRKLRTIPNMFILSLAVADLIMGGFVLPIGAHYVVGSRWLLGDFLCEIWTSVDVLSVTASIGTLCIISLDRYVAITMPFEYSLRMTRPRARFIIGAVWIISAATAFVPIHLGLWKSDKPIDECCYKHKHCCEFRTNATYGVVSSCISFYIPLLVMVAAYSIVFKSKWSVNGNWADQK